MYVVKNSIVLKGAVLEDAFSSSIGLCSRADGLKLHLIFLELPLGALGFQLGLILCLLLVDVEEGAGSVADGQPSGEEGLVELPLHSFLVLFLRNLKGLADGVALLDELLLLVYERVGVGEGVELPAWVGVVTNRLVFQIRVL